jgi:hypothetical protein
MSRLSFLSLTLIIFSLIHFNHAFAQSNSKKPTREVKHKQLEERRRQRLKALFHKKPLGIRPPVVVKQDTDFKKKKLDSFKSKVSLNSEVERRELLDKRLREESRNRSLEKNRKTQALIRKRKQQQARMALLKRRALEQQRRQRLIDIQKELIKQQVTDIANDLNRDILKSGLK